MTIKDKVNDVDVSIVTINWNVSDKLQNCIDSFLNTYEDLNYEWFIIDNNSQDVDFNDIIRKYSKYKRLIFINNKKNEGGVVLNKIIDRVKGRYWIFLNPDTLQKGKTIEELIKFMDLKKDAGMASSKQLKPNGSPLIYYGTRFTLAKVFFLYIVIGKFIDQHFLSNKMMQYYNYHNLDVNKLTEIDQPPGGCMIVRTELILEDGYVIDPEFPFYMNDVDQAKRIRDKGYKIYLVPSSEIIHDHSSSFKKRKRLWRKMEYLKSQIKYFRKHYRNKLWILKTLLISDILYQIISNIVKHDKRKFKILFWKFRNILKW